MLIAGSEPDRIRTELDTSSSRLSHARIGALFAKSVSQKRSAWLIREKYRKRLNSSGECMSKLITYDESKKPRVVKTSSCPNCSSPYINRLRRATTYQRLISFLYVYPFSCQLCGHSFKLFQPGVRYVRVDEDQREHQRMRVHLQIRLTQGTTTYNGAVIDISMRGCTVKTADHLPLGCIAKVELKVPNDRNGLIVKAAIVRNTSHDRIGLEFLRFEDEERQRLRQFVQSLLASDYH
jgi:PilZ domain-containing protein